MRKLPAEFARLFGYVRPYRGRLTGAVVLLAAVGLAEGLTALMVRPVVDRILDPSPSDAAILLLNLPFGGRAIYLNQFFPQSFRHVFVIFAISLLVIYLGKALAEFLGGILVQHVGLSAVTDLRNQLYARLIRQPIGFFQLHPVGRLMSTVVNDVERVRYVVSEWLAEFIRQTFTLVFLVGVLFLLSWKMALAAVVLMPVILWPLDRLGRRIRGSSERSQTRLADLSQMLGETLAGNRIVKAFGMEDFEIGRFRARARKLLRENMRWISAYILTSPLMDILAAVVICLVLLYARDQIRQGVMTRGHFMAFAFALFSAYTPLKRLGSFYQQTQQALGASTHVFQLLDLQEEPAEQAGAIVLPPFSRSIEFEGVGFAYDGTKAVLRSIRLSAKAGEVVAIVGSSGVGKTTLVNLLPRFYDVTSGAVRVDGHDVRCVTLRSLREQIAIVTQETILFHDTVWNNLCYGRPGLTEERVHAAARAALAHDFILELPQGYHTVIGERGQLLSGGQRQRLAIARALLKDAPILILDEATSELDSESEMLVQQALANLMVGRTVFVIAHRLSTIRRADRIVVLEDGAIAESGTHAELLARRGTYARLYELQFADVERTPAPVRPGSA